MPTSSSWARAIAARSAACSPAPTAERLLHGAPCAVAIAPRGYERGDVRHIGVAYEGSPEAEAALRAAEALALELDAALTVYCVVEPPPRDGSMIAAGTGARVAVGHRQAARPPAPVLRRRPRARAGSDLETLLLHGHAAEQIARRTRRRGRSPVRRIPRLRAAAPRAARQRVRRARARRRLPGRHHAALGRRRAPRRRPLRPKPRTPSAP